MALCTRLHRKKIGGRRIGVVSNAGFETVGMADTIRGARYEVEMAALHGDTIKRMTDALTHPGSDGHRQRAQSSRPDPHGR